MKHTIEYKLNSIERLSDNRYARIIDLSSKSIKRQLKRNRFVCDLCIHKHEACNKINTCDSSLRKDKRDTVSKQIF